MLRISNIATASASSSGSVAVFAATAAAAPNTLSEWQARNRCYELWLWYIDGYYKSSGYVSYDYGRH